MKQGEPFLQDAQSVDAYGPPPRLSEQDQDWLGVQSARLALDVGLAPFVAHILTAWSVVAVFAPFDGLGTVMIWAVALTLLISGQALFVLRVRARVLTPDDAMQTKRVFLLCGVLIGVSWSTLFVLLFPDTVDYNVIYLAFAAGGLSMGAVATQHMLPWSVVTAVVTSLVCLAGQFVLSGFPNGIFHALCILLYAAVMVDLTFRLRRLALKASVLQVEQRRLLEQIANARARKAQADERQRVARDMHDSVGQWLASVKLRLQSIAAEIHGGRTIKRGRLAELVADMDVLINDTRRIAHDLSPSTIAHSGLHTALLNHADDLRDAYNISVEMNLEDELELPTAYSDHVYRIVQQATTNAIVHGKADMIHIHLELTDQSMLHLVIRDNGNGFELRTQRQAHSLGLDSIRDRAGLMNGDVRIKTAPNKGTEIDVIAAL